MDNRKYITMALALAMVAGAFAAAVPATRADIVNLDDSRNIWYSWTDLDDDVVFIGEVGVVFDIRVENDFDGGGEDLENCSLAISTTVRTEGGSAVSPSPIDDWAVREVVGAGINDNGWDDFDNFEFDVEPDATPGIYNLTVTLTYNVWGDATDYEYTGYILFEIAYRAEVGDMPLLIPGDRDKAVQVWVESYNTWNSEMSDIELAITLPDADFSWFGIASLTTSSSSGYIDDWGDWSDFPFMVSVDADKDSGTYTGSYTLTYNNADGVLCTEAGSMDFPVGNLAMISATIATGTIAQGTTAATMVLTFTNTGTVDLFAAKVWIDDDSEAFFFTVADHWEGAGTVTYGWVELGDLAVGATVTRNMEVGIDLYIPEGQHKLLFAFSAMYMDPDTLTYQAADGWWDWLGIEHVPKVEMAGTTITLDPESSTVEGTFVWITVTDTAMDVSISSLVTLTTAGRIMDNALALSVRNLGNIDFTNVVLRIETNTADSPFLNVVDPTALLSEPAQIAGTFWAGDNENVNVQVDLKPDTDLGVYMVPVTISAINLDMGEVMTTVVDARVTIRGVGPQLEVTSVTPLSVKPGAAFTLTIVLTNVGDDTARNVIINTATIGLGETQTTVDGNYAEPQPDALPLYVGDIAPGATLTVEIPMRANSDMSKGHVYSIVFAVDFVDSFGLGPATDTISVTVESTGSGGSVMGMFYWSLIVLVFVIVAFLIVVLIFHVKKNRKPKAGSAQDYQQPPPEQQ
jgi:hypothetical protein